LREIIRIMEKRIEEGLKRFNRFEPRFPNSRWWDDQKARED